MKGCRATSLPPTRCRTSKTKRQKCDLDHNKCTEELENGLPGKSFLQFDHQPVDSGDVDDKAHNSEETT